MAEFWNPTPAAQLAPLGTMPRLPRKLRYQDPVSLRTIIEPCIRVCRSEVKATFDTSPVFALWRAWPWVLLT